MKQITIFFFSALTILLLTSCSKDVAPTPDPGPGGGTGGGTTGGGTTTSTANVAILRTMPNSCKPFWSVAYNAGFDTTGSARIQYSCNWPLTDNTPLYGGWRCKDSASWNINNNTVLDKWSSGDFYTETELPGLFASPATVTRDVNDTLYRGYYNRKNDFDTVVVFCKIENIGSLTIKSATATCTEFNNEILLKYNPSYVNYKLFVIDTKTADLTSPSSYSTYTSWDKMDKSKPAIYTVGGGTYVAFPLMALGQSSDGYVGWTNKGGYNVRIKITFSDGSVAWQTLVRGWRKAQYSYPGNLAHLN